MDITSPRCVVLGVGNTLWSDEGVGPRLIDLLNARYEVTGAEIVDGGTQGLYLLPLVSEADRLLVFDAVKLGHPPGTVVALKNEEIDSVFRGALSLHQTSLHDLLGSAQLIGRAPQTTILIGIEAKDTENWGGPPTPDVEAALPEALAKAIDILKGWGLDVREKAA